jgi:hypothetical protein
MLWLLHILLWVYLAYIGRLTLASIWILSLYRGLLLAGLLHLHLHGLLALHHSRLLAHVLWLGRHVGVSSLHAARLLHHHGLLLAGHSSVNGRHCAVLGVLVLAMGHHVGMMLTFLGLLSPSAPVNSSDNANDHTYDSNTADDW